LHVNAVCVHSYEQFVQKYRSNITSWLLGIYIFFTWPQRNIEAPNSLLLCFVQIIYHWKV